MFWKKVGKELSGMSAYRQAIRHLPKPTLAQTERFAKYVSSAHSWYKHLPIRPKVPFVFYLDPGAGMNVVQTHTGETALVEITGESSQFHYTWQTTVDYRRRFGHWNYHRTHGTTFMYPADGGVVNTAGAGLSVLTEAGDWVEVPPALVKAGTALVNAFIHPDPNFHIWLGGSSDRFGLASILGDSSASSWHDRLKLLCGVIQHECQWNVRLANMIESVPSEAIELVKDAHCQNSDMVSSLGIGRSWDWPDEDLLNQLRSSGLSERLVSAAIKYTGVIRHRSQLEKDVVERANGLYEPKDEMSRAVDAIAEERGQQLMAATDAMSRFLEASKP